LQDSQPSSQSGKTNAHSSTQGKTDKEGDGHKDEGQNGDGNRTAVEGKAAEEKTLGNIQQINDLGREGSINITSGSSSSSSSSSSCSSGSSSGSSSSSKPGKISIKLKPKR